MTGLLPREEFAARHRAEWVRLERLAGLASHGKLDRFTTAEVFELGDLYRSATSHLAIARRDYPGDRVETYLNSLVARAHTVVYTQQASSMRRVVLFFRFGFPAAIRDAFPYVFLAFAVFALSGAISALVVALQPSAADVLLPGEAQSLRNVMSHHHLWVQQATENHSAAADHIMLKNIKVAFRAFAGGMVAGVFAFYILAMNGISLGVVGALVAQNHLSVQFWAFVAPHGVIELSVVFMAGGAGLMIGDALLRPGLQRRADALGDAVRVSVQILLGCIPLLVVAGTIEAFFSPSAAPVGLKGFVAVVLAVALYTYIYFSKPAQSEHQYGFEDVLTGALSP
ncbi:MAG: stage II sporulation protein M [Chloroflexota bacterium]